MSELVLEQVSRWFGNVVAVNDVTMTVGPGVTGLLGPNGAGKSTIIHMASGFIAPSSGRLTIDGHNVRDNIQIYRRIGIVPEHEPMYDAMSGWQFVLANARLHGLSDPEAATRRAIATVDMATAQDRDINTYSKGMRQRIKLATAIVHDPAVLLLDEPFNGMDPRQRAHLMEVLTQLGTEQGRTVLFSSHILEEVEQIATNIEVLVAGRHAASGDFREIRRLMTQRPHRYLVRSSNDRALASALIAERCTSGVTVEQSQRGPALSVDVTDLRQFSRAVASIAARDGIQLHEMSPTDESLESVFAYLVSR